ncbi:MAG: DNA-deoxyinosine glycosylase [Pseudomonadota bacterium]
MTQCEAFPPLVGHAPHTLILGSMPGVKSLQENRYYAHPQNQFWRLIGDIFDIPLPLPYDTRVMKLTGQGIAVWDVLKTCERAGSLDSAIRNPVTNDFATFFARYPSIQTVIFNNATAETLYRRYVLPTLADNNVTYHRLPSPSPAYAAMPYSDKLACWKNVFG